MYLYSENQRFFLYHPKNDEIQIHIHTGKGTKKVTELLWIFIEKCLVKINSKKYLA